MLSSKLCFGALFNCYYDPKNHRVPINRCLRAVFKSYKLIFICASRISLQYSFYTVLGFLVGITFALSLSTSIVNEVVDCQKSLGWTVLGKNTRSVQTVSELVKNTIIEISFKCHR